MKNGLSKRLTAMSLRMLLACAPLQAFAAGQPSDYGGHWAETHIRTWIDRGYLHSDDNGNIHPDDNVARVEFMSLVNQSFGFPDSLDTSVNEHPEAADVSPDDPAYETVTTALAAGYIKGDPEGSVRPLDPLTREQAAVIIARLLELDGAEPADALGRFRDAADIAGWSKAAVASVVAKGLIVGFGDGTFRPGSLLTRAEAVAILDRALRQRYAEVYDEAGIYGPESGTQTLEGDVLIDTPGVTLRNIFITGNLTIGEGVGEGEAVLDNVSIDGDTFVQGGGVNSIYFKDSVIVKIVINKKTGDVRIVAEGSTKVNEVNVQSSARIDSSKATSGGIANVTLADRLPAGSRVSLLGNFDNVQVNAGAVEVDVPEGSINNLNVSGNAGSASLNLGTAAKIGNLVLNAALKVTGQGTIEKATIEKGAEGTTFEKTPADVRGDWTPPASEPSPDSNPSPTPSTDPAPNPADPADPPTDPADPADPIDPADPTDPIDPADPTDPADPADPTDPTDPTDPPTVVQLVFDANVPLFTGDSLQLTLQAKLSDDTLEDVTDEATDWTSSDESVVTVDATGRVTAVGAGSAVITAQYEGFAAAFVVTATVSPINLIGTAQLNESLVVVDLALLTRDDDGSYIMTAASDTHDYLFIGLTVEVDAAGAGAELKGTYRGNDYMLYLKYGPVEAGKPYDLFITGLKKKGSSPEDMGTLRIRFRR